jgi:DNA-binding SARP family transcriptional activator/tetratricopeptide (TPR) repeat protein
MLGPLEALADGRSLDLGGQKQRALLAVLLLEANRVVSADRLIEALWEEEPPETAGKALQVYVSQLRKLLGKERLQTKAPGYLLRVEEGELDLERFQRLHAEGMHAEALLLWRGPPLAEFVYRRFAQSEIARLEELRLACLEDRIDSDLASGRHAELVGELDALVRAQPLRQRLRAQVMLALYRSGRDAEALEAYQDAREVLVEQLGIEPRRELRELQQAILNQDPVLDLVAEHTAAAESARGAFVGRERELDELVAGLDDAFAGRGRLFLLVGEPGIGKSRLADELISRARARAARVLIGRCWEAGGAPAYWPWVQSLRAYVRETEPATLRAQLGAGSAELAQFLPELRELFPDLPEPPALEPESARFRLFEAVSSFLRSAAQTRPLVLVLDDLHAADEPSLLLLQFLARELGESRLLVVGAYRDVDPSPTDPLTVAVTELVREPVTRSVALGGLGERDVARFIELTSGETPSEELVVSVHAETEGNPLFVGEIVRLLAAEGGLDDAAAPPRLAIPQSVRDVIARRLRHLSQECNRVLVLASVLGREFVLDALARVGGVSEVELLETLDEAMIARVVSDVPGNRGRLRFAHVLIRDSLYEGLTTARRVRLHRQAAEALETVYGDEPGPHLAELAYHTIAGSDFDNGLVYARRAGDRAIALLAYEEAARLYQTALDALAATGHHERRTDCELLLSLGEAESRAGNSSAAAKAFFDAAGIARRLGLSRELARAAADYGGRIVWARAGDDVRLVPLLEEGLAALGDEDVELRVRLLARLSGALRDEPARERRDALSREAVELARRTGNLAALAYALDGRLYAIIAPDSIAECLDLGAELCDVAEQIGDTERLVQGHMHKFIAHVTIGDVHNATAELALVGRIADELRQPVQRWQVRGAEAMLALATGSLAAAEELIEDAFALGRHAIPAALPHYTFQRYTLCEFQGKLAEVEQAMSAVVSAHPARPVFRCALAHLHAQLGRDSAARRELDDLARDDFSGLPLDMEWLLATSLLAETSALLGDTQAATILYRLLLPYATFNAVDTAEGMRGSVSRYLGLLATTMSRWDEATNHFENALAMNERMGARPWLAHAQHDYARMLLARDGSGDRNQALELLAGCAETCRELGMRALEERASALREQVLVGAGR